MYICEGNTGGGKSTFLKLLSAKIPEIDVSYEPLVNWQKKVDGESIFGNFFKDSKRWAYAMETYAMLSRVQAHLCNQERSDFLHIIERSIYSGHYVFAISSYQSGFMTPLEWDLYNQWFNFMIPKKCKPPKGFIYLKVDPEISYGRLKKRARVDECAAPLDYWKKLSRNYENFLIRKENVLPELKEVPVLVLDGNEEFEDNPVVFEGLVKQVKDFLTSTKS